MIPPCRTDGKRCQGRKTGCQACCEKYKAFREEQDRLNAQLQPAKEAVSFLCNSGRAKSARNYKNRFKK